MNDAKVDRIQPIVHRGVRIGLGPTVHCALIATVAFFFVPWREILIRWRRTVPNLAALGLYTLVFYTFAASWVVAFAIGRRRATFRVHRRHRGANQVAH